MVGRIFFIADVEQSEFERGTWEEFKIWFTQQLSYQFDIESNVAEKWIDYKLISLQFGSCIDPDVQWFIQWSALSDLQKQEMKELLEDASKLKLIHNARFEYIVLRVHDIIIENVYDTMLGEKILKGGMENFQYSLADISWKYLSIMMDKSEQTNFGDNVITDSKIYYGITDVAHLSIIRKMQLDQAAIDGLLNVFSLEMDAVLGFSDITFNGMKLDQEKWRENIRLAEPLVEKAYADLNIWLDDKPSGIARVARDLGYISEQDRITISWGSWQQKTELLTLIFPDIPGGSKPIIKKYIRDNGTVMSTEKLNILVGISDKDHKAMQDYLLANHRDYLIANGYLIPAGQSTINWNSSDQALPLVRCVVPKIKGLSEEERNKWSHPILKQYEAYKQSLKLINDLGEEFIRKYVDSDGMVRTNIDQVKASGRVGSSNPNLQNIVVKEFVGTRYRNAFIPHDPEWEFVSSDYVSQELVLVSFVSQEPSWLEAISQGKDLHSICAELIYGNKWKDAAEADCAYYKMIVNKEGVLEQAKQKCECKKHKPLRYDIKTVNFLLIYGGGKFKLSSELEIPVKEADALMNLYFSKLPYINRLLKFLKHFTLSKGYSKTLAPFFRKRWFPYWYENRMYITEHEEEIRYNPTLGEIEKAGANHLIQGSSADITKLAMVLIRNYIRDNNLWHKVRIVAQVHDQIDTTCHKSFTEEWKVVLDRLMCDAGKLVIPTGILKADTSVSLFWTK
jgi:DNA polymerase I-like protein with 3'-5' exonuclease and polymerase domains